MEPPRSDNFSIHCRHGTRCFSSWPQAPSGRFVQSVARRPPRHMPRRSGWRRRSNATTCGRSSDSSCALAMTSDLSESSSDAIGRWRRHSPHRGCPANRRPITSPAASWPRTEHRHQCRSAHRAITVRFHASRRAADGNRSCKPHPFGPNAESNDWRANVPRHTLNDRIRAEYLEMPGLHLTTKQVARLCGVDATHCSTALVALVESGFLKVRHDGSYVRASEGKIPRSTAAKANLRSQDDPSGEARM